MRRVSLKNGSEVLHLQYVMEKGFVFSVGVRIVWWDVQSERRHKQHAECVHTHFKLPGSRMMTVQQNDEYCATQWSHRHRFRIRYILILFSTCSSCSNLNWSAYFFMHGCLCFAWNELHSWLITAILTKKKGCSSALQVIQFWGAVCRDVKLELAVQKPNDHKVLWSPDAAIMILCLQRPCDVYKFLSSSRWPNILFIKLSDWQTYLIITLLRVWMWWECFGAV